PFCEKPRNRTATPDPFCAETTMAPAHATDNATTTTNWRISAHFYTWGLTPTIQIPAVFATLGSDPTRAGPLKRHLLQRRDSRSQRRMRREQVRPEPFLDVHPAAQRIRDAQMGRALLDRLGRRAGRLDLLERMRQPQRIARQLGARRVGQILAASRHHHRQ